MNFTSDFEIARQGSLDGLCGIYSLVNFFTRLADPDDPWEYARRCFRIALRAQEDADQLTAHNLAAGFWQGRLISAAKVMCAELNPSVNVMTLPAYMKQKSFSNPLQIAKSLKQRGAAIFNMNAPRGHWILAYATPTGAVKFDDSASGKTLQLGSKVIAEREFDLSKGLVLSYAKTH